MRIHDRISEEYDNAAENDVKHERPDERELEVQSDDDLVHHRTLSENPLIAQNVRR